MNESFVWDLKQMWPLKWAHLLYGKIYLALILINIVTTVFIVLVLVQKHMRSPVNILLLYMAIADFALAIAPFPVLFFIFTLDYYRTVPK